MDPAPEDYVDYDDTERLPVLRTRAARALIAIVTLLIGLALLGLWRVLDGNERVPFARDATPPRYVHVTSDHTYALAVPGGVRAMLARGIAVSQSQGTIALQCDYTPQGSAASISLQVSPESSESKAETTVGTFVAPVTGDIAVKCTGWGAVFVPNSDDRPTDYAGWALLGAIITLTAGAVLGLSELRLLTLRLSAARERDEVERVVDPPIGSGDDGEVGGRDRDDVRE